MKRGAAIVDTNVVVSALLTKSDSSPVARILDGMLTAAFPFVLSEALLAEYRTVLVRPEMRKLHGLAILEIEAVLVDIAHHAIVLDPKAGPPAPDPGDQHLWDLLAVRADLTLVTGDKPLLRDRGMHGRVLAAAAFVHEALPG